MISTQFEDEVHAYQAFVKKNFHLLGSNYQLITEQYVINSGIIDMLAYNKEKECLAIIELKNIKVDSSVVSQVLRYYRELKNKYIDNYIISNPPEMIIISVDFDENFTITYNMPIHLYQMNIKNNNIIFNKVIPYVEDFNNNIYADKRTELKTSRNNMLFTISKKQKILANNIIKYLKLIFINNQLPLDKFNIINSNDHIDILYDKIVAKVTFPRAWFSDHIQLSIYNRLYKYYNFNIGTDNDPAVKKVQKLKTMTKFNINDIPRCFKRLV